MTRSRKSLEYGFGIVPPEIESMPSDSLINNSLGIFPDSSRAENALAKGGAIGVSNFAQLLWGRARTLGFPQTGGMPNQNQLEVVKPSLWTGAGGVVVGMFLLSYGFGFMRQNTAEKLASTSSESAVIAALFASCDWCAFPGTEPVGSCGAGVHLHRG